MQRLTLDQPIPEQPAREHRRARQFRRLPPRPPGGGRPRRSRAAIHERRPVIVATFDPHPVRYFKPDVPPFRLTTPRPARAAVRPCRRRRDAGVPVRRRARGDQRRGFRRRAAGRADRRRGRGHRRRFHLRQGPRRQRRGAASSSARKHRHRRRGGRAGAARRRARSRPGRIREALAAGDPRHRDAAAEPRRSRSKAWSSAATARGRELGCPTANVRLGDYQRPAYGIYAVRVGSTTAANIPASRASASARPSTRRSSCSKRNLFGFDGDLYGRTIEVALHAYIRPERKFDEPRRARRADAGG